MHSSRHTQKELSSRSRTPNIFLTSRGQVKILDFGLAKIDRRKEEGSAVETAIHPGTDPRGLDDRDHLVHVAERARRQLTDARTDLFSSARSSLDGDRDPSLPRNVCIHLRFNTGPRSADIGELNPNLSPSELDHCQGSREGPGIPLSDARHEVHFHAPQAEADSARA